MTLSPNSPHYHLAQNQNRHTSHADPAANASVGCAAWASTRLVDAERHPAVPASIQEGPFTENRLQSPLYLSTGSNTSRSTKTSLLIYGFAQGSPGDGPSLEKEGRRDARTTDQSPPPPPLGTRTTLHDAISDLPFPSPTMTTHVTYQEFLGL